jgi:transposase
LKAVQEIYPEVTGLAQFLAAFYSVFDTASIVALDKFIDFYSLSHIDSLAQFAVGLRDDYEAIKNSILYPEISNGPMEGINSKLKMLHRRSRGRASLELLLAYAA